MVLALSECLGFFRFPQFELYLQAENSVPARFVITLKLYILKHIHLVQNSVVFISPNKYSTGYGPSTLPLRLSVSY